MLVSFGTRQKLTFHPLRGPYKKWATLLFNTRGSPTRRFFHSIAPIIGLPARGNYLIQQQDWLPAKFGRARVHSRIQSGPMDGQWLFSQREHFQWRAVINAKPLGASIVGGLGFDSSKSAMSRGARQEMDHLSPCRQTFSVVRTVDVPDFGKLYVKVNRCVMHIMQCNRCNFLMPCNQHQVYLQHIALV